MRPCQQLERLLGSFLVYLEVERGFSPHTIDAYRRDCHHLFEAIEACIEEGDARLRPRTNEPVDLLTERTIFEYLVRERQRQRESASIRRGLSAVRTFLRFLVRERVLPDNPAKLIETPKTWKLLPNVLEEGEVSRLLAATVEHPSRYPLRDRAIFEVLYASGLRVAELCGLRLEDVRSDLGILHCHGKGSRERIVPISETARRATEVYVEEERPRFVRQRPSNLVFLSRAGRALGREVIAKMVRKYALAAGLPGKITPHTLRHSFATHLLRGGADLRVVQEILGHVKLETTEIYTHIERSDLKKVHREFHPRG